MRTAHTKHPIRKKHFAKVVDHLADTLRHLGVDRETTSEILAAVAPLSAEIINTADDGISTPTTKEQAVNHLNASRGGSAVAEMDPGIASGVEPELTEALNGMKGALDALGTNVFIADRDLRLVYMNRRASEMMKSLSSIIEGTFGISHRQLIGTKIDAFHGNRAKQIRSMLNDPSNLPIRTEIRLGEMILDLNVNAILSPENEYLGVVVNWEEIAEKKRLEAEAAKVQSMMENMPVNVLFAGTDLKLAYINPASIKQLRSL